MFAKELSGPEIAELSENGICTTIPEKLQPYRVIKWEEVMKLPRHGNVTYIGATCQVTEERHLSNLKLKIVMFTAIFSTSQSQVRNYYPVTVLKW